MGMRRRFGGGCGKRFRKKDRETVSNTSGVLPNTKHVIMVVNLTSDDNGRVVGGSLKLSGLRYYNLIYYKITFFVWVKAKQHSANEDDEDDEQSTSIERKETKREAEIKDKEKDDDGIMNVLGWSFKYSAGSVSKSTTAKDNKEMKYGKGIVEDEGKEKKISSIIKEKKDKKDIVKDSVKDSVKIEEESFIVRRQHKKIHRKDLGQVEHKMDDIKDKNEDKNANDNEGEDKSKMTPALIRKLEKIRHADKDIVRSVERPVSKSIDQIKLQTKPPTEKVKREVQRIIEEPKKIETAKPTKIEPTEEKEVKETKSTKVTKVKVEEKKVKKIESIESTKDKLDEDKKTKKTEIVKATKTEHESSKPSLKSEEKRKSIAKTETLKATTPSTKTKKEEDESIKAKVKIEVPQTARNETKSKTKKLRDATESLADLNDKILSVPTFVPNFTAVENTNCQQHGKIFLRQLRGYKLWAFQMLDSSAKISSSILRGNINQLGDFDQCLGIMSHVKMGNRTIKIQGKYCLASIDIYATQAEMKLPVNLMQARTIIKSNMRDPGHFVPKFTTIRWALCLPAACTAKDAEMTLINALNYYNSTFGIKFMVDVNPDMCYTKQKSQSYSKETIGVLYFYVAVICLAIIATIRDYVITSEGKGLKSDNTLYQS
ncbi:hypothetical protein M0802_000184 [Mischocyttarus mexicanus]|nr:hypothetical protein M0802_000184 [Mischocyttarus mexicanus]